MILAKCIPHTNISVQIYTTSTENKGDPLKGRPGRIINLDIKVCLIGKLDRLDEIAHHFNESLKILEENKKASMRSSKLPPISEVGFPQTTKNATKTARPMSALINQSIESKEGLYTSINHFVAKPLHIKAGSHRRNLKPKNHP